MKTITHGEVRWKKLKEYLTNKESEYFQVNIIHECLMQVHWKSGKIEEYQLNKKLPEVKNALSKFQLSREDYYSEESMNSQFFLETQEKLTIIEIGYAKELKKVKAEIHCYEKEKDQISEVRKRIPYTIKDKELAEQILNFYLNQDEFRVRNVVGDIKIIRFY